MNLAEQLIALRKTRGWSQEELAAQLDISRQSVSKWESGSAVPELERVIQLSELFGVTTDELLKGSAASRAEEAPTPVPRAEAEAFLQIKWRSAPRVALGVLLCILGAAILICASCLAGLEGSESAELLYIGLGFVALIALCAVAVALFITTGMKTSRFEYLDRQAILLTPDTRAMVLSRRDSYEQRYRRGMVAGVCLCIVSCIPLFLAVASGSETMMLLSVVALLLICAAGATILIHTGIRMASFQKLLEEGDYSRAQKSDTVARSLSGIYWLVAVAVYLVISLPTGRWESTWVVWPIAGLLFAALQLVLRLRRR